MTKTIITISLFWLTFLVATPAGADVDSALDMAEYVRSSGLIFKGKVIKVEYKNSVSDPKLDPFGQPIYEDGDPVYVDGSNLPHTFVTFSVEQLLKGSLSTRDPKVILRFEGGESDVPDPCVVGPGGEPIYTSFFTVSDVPLFDVNDRDFLFVKGNTPTPCLLYKWAGGRFRILDDPNLATSINMIYSEYGEQVRLIYDTLCEPNGIFFGDVQQIADVLSHTMGHFELLKVYNDGEVEEEPNDVPVVPGAHATESGFGAFIARVVEDECGTGVPPGDCGIEYVSPDPNLPFFGIELTDDEPNDVEEPEPVFTRPWLDDLDPNDLDVILEQERIERGLFELTDNNPVLPETPCEFQILYHGPLIGDVSGPEGKPDCHVDFFDAAATFGVWLECNDPDDPTCFN